MQAMKPYKGGCVHPYGSVFHWHEDNTEYKEEHLKSWTNAELILKHYHLTARLDGYNHLSATENMKNNAFVFREELKRRGIDGIQHCIEMDMRYDWGYRHVAIFSPKYLDPDTQT